METLNSALEAAISRYDNKLICEIEKFQKSTTQPHISKKVLTSVRKKNSIYFQECSEIINIRKEERYIFLEIN